MQTVIERIHLVRTDVMVVMSSNVIYNVLPVGGAANTLMLSDITPTEVWVSSAGIKPRVSLVLV